MDTNIDTSPFNDPEWSAKWHAKRNAQVQELVDDGTAGRLWKQTGDLSRGEADDEQVRWLFWRQYKPDTEQSNADRLASPDAYLYEGVTACMKRARDDERKRFAHALSNGLKSMLGDEFTSLMYDIADENGINIGRD